MDRSEKRKHIRRSLSKFKSFRDVIYLLEELFQRDEETLSRLLGSLPKYQKGNRSKGGGSLKNFLISLEDNILSFHGPERWLSSLGFIDLIAFHLYKSSCKWKTFKLEDAPKSPFTEEELIHLRSSIKKGLPSKNVNTVQELIIRSKEEDEEEALPVQCLFRVSSVSMSKARKSDPKERQEQVLRSKPLFFAYFNGSPFLFSPVTLRKQGHKEAIAGAFGSSAILNKGHSSNDLPDLFQSVNKQSGESAADDAEMNGNAEEEPHTEPGKKIPLNDVYIEACSSFKSAYTGKMKSMLRIHGENIYDGLVDLRKLEIIDVVDSCNRQSAWMESLGGIKANDQLLVNNELRPNENPMCENNEWNVKLKQRNCRMKPEPRR